MARKPLSNIPDPLSETRSWSPPAARPESCPLKSASSRLAKAREVLSVLAKAQRGLVFHDRPTTVALSYQDAPAVEPAIVEAAERLAASGDLVLHQGLLVVHLSLALPETHDGSDRPWAPSRPEGRSN